MKPSKDFLSFATSKLLEGLRAGRAGQRLNPNAQLKNPSSKVKIIYLKRSKQTISHLFRKNCKNILTNESENKILFEVETHEQKVVNTNDSGDFS